MNSEPPTLANPLEGILDLLILKSFSSGEMHGLGISRRSSRSRLVPLLLRHGRLFAAHDRMEEKTLDLTNAGKKQLEAEPSDGAAFLGQLRRLCKLR